jgi:hypothetical protein
MFSLIDRVNFGVFRAHFFSATDPLNAGMIEKSNSPETMQEAHYVGSPKITISARSWCSQSRPQPS